MTSGSSSRAPQLDGPTGLGGRLGSMAFTFGEKHPRLVAVLVLLLVLGALSLADRVRFNTNLSELLPRDNDAITVLRDTAQDFESFGLVLIGLERGAETPITSIQAYADALAAELRSTPGVEWLAYHRDDLITDKAQLVTLAPLYMNESDLDWLLRTADSEEALIQSSKALAAALQLPTSNKELHRLDPLGMVPRALENWASTTGPVQGDFGSGYLVDAEQNFVLLLVEPAGPRVDVDFSRELLAQIDLANERAFARWSSEGWQGPARPRLIVAGGHATTVEDARVLRADLRDGAVVALTAVVALFALAFARPMALVIAFIPLFGGVALAFGFAVVALGQLNTVTACFAALLIGLGIDFVIVIYARYVEERRRGITHSSALAVCGKQTVRSVVLGAVTTAATFLAFATSDFGALRQLGVLTATGVLLVMLAVLLLTPALLTLTRRTQPAKMRSFGSRWLMLWCHRHPRVVLIATAVTTALLGVVASDTRYDDLPLRATETHEGRQRSRLLEAFGRDSTPLLIRVDGASETQAQERARILRTELEALLNDGSLARVESLLPMVPALDRQQATLMTLRSFKPSRPVGPALASALATAGLRPAAFSEGIENLERALALDAPIGMTDLPLGPLTGHYTARTRDGVGILLYAYLPAGLQSRHPPPSLIDIVDSMPWATLTGGLVVANELRRIAGSDSLVAGVLGTLVVFGLLARDLKGLRPALKALLPISVGLIWMLGLMNLAGIGINFMNLFVFVMVIGIGVDYGIHTLHRLRESDADIERVAGLAPAITVCSLTTILGFGSLGLSHSPGLKSMGLAAICGVLAVGWLALTLLPALAGLHADLEREE